MNEASPNQIRKMQETIAVQAEMIKTITAQRNAFANENASLQVQLTFAERALEQKVPAVEDIAAALRKQAEKPVQEQLKEVFPPAAADEPNL